MFVYGSAWGSQIADKHMMDGTVVNDVWLSDNSVSFYVSFKLSTDFYHFNPNPATIFIMKMLSAFYICCIYLGALIRLDFFHGSKQHEPWSDYTSLYTSTVSL